MLFFLSKIAEKKTLFFEWFRLLKNIHGLKSFGLNIFYIGHDNIEEKNLSVTK